jgi:fumarylpyruvate hydrolase
MNFAFEPPRSVCVPIAGRDDCFPVHRVYCVGRNYADHAREMGGSPEREPPFFFSKPADAVILGSPVPYPPMTRDLHHEVELVVALGSGGYRVNEETALDRVFGYAVGVDLTRRDLQAIAKRQGRPWDVAKGFDHSAPLSSIVPASRTGHPAAGVIRLSVNGEEKQRGNLSQMIWSVAEVIMELSRYFELKAGDLVFTGTPAGVGAVQPGDRLECDIEGVGELKFTMDDV